jgi:hypothetical protein
VDFCRDKEGNLIGEEVEIRDRWKEYFEELLNMKSTGSEGEEEELERYTNVEPEVERPTIQELIDAIKYLKNNKAPGEDAITAEMMNMEVKRYI